MLFINTTNIFSRQYCLTHGQGLPVYFIGATCLSVDRSMNKVMMRFIVAVLIENAEHFLVTNSLLPSHNKLC